MDKEMHEKFVCLLSQVQPELRRYIYSLCLNMGDTDDILQETALALWRKFETYDSSQPFLNWSFRFAYYEVMKFREKQKKQFILCETTLKILSEEQGLSLEKSRAQQRLLKECVEKLSAEEKEFIRLRYGENKNIAELNILFSESGKKIYRAFEKMRFKLFKCIDLRLTEEGWR